MPPPGRLGCSADFSPRIQTSETGETTKGRKAREAPMKCELCGKEFRPRAAATVLLQILPPESRLSSEKEQSRSGEEEQTC